MPSSRKHSTVSNRPSMDGRGSLSLRHRNSMASVDTSISNLLDENNYEMFSGAASEVIPSSISSFHQAHNLRRSSIESVEPYPEDDDERSLLRRVTTNGTAHSQDKAGFKFFTVDEIENAPGFGSTLEDPENPIDYDTNWEYSNDRGDAHSVVEEFNYGLTDNSPRMGYRERSASNLSDDIRLMGVSGSADNASDKSYLSDESSSNVRNRYRKDSLHVFQGYQKATLHHQRYYIAEEDLVIGIAGYRTTWQKTAVYYLVCWLTFGLGYLVLRWFPRSRINMKGVRVPLGNADWVVIENEFGELSVLDVEKAWYDKRLSSFLPLSNERADDETSPQLESEKDPVVPFLLTFEYRYLKFFYSPMEDIFKTNSTWHDPSWMDFEALKVGLSKETHRERLEIFSGNNINIREKSSLQLLVDEVLHPFYMFQVFSIFLWLMDNYYYYASCIFIISMVSVVQTLVETKSSMKKMQTMSKNICEIRVRRNDFWKQIESTDLVPGDVYEIDPSLATLPCDSVLLSGDCVVNESMLTGESAPVSKFYATEESLSQLSENFSSNALLRSFLFNGTKILKIKRMNDEPVTALVVKTGFSTTKGSLIRSMLFPKPTGFKFYRDSFKYIGFMSCIAAIGFVISTINFIRLGVSYRTMILRALDIITIVVPPALPATLTIGTSFALARLKKAQIYCIAPTRVNIGGKVDVLCFDKTGTLTEDGLDVLGVHLATNAKDRREYIFNELVCTVGVLPLERDSIHDSNNGSKLLACMATCHTLRVIDEELVGDPLDYKMFDFTEWSYDEDYQLPDAGPQDFPIAYPMLQKSQGFVTVKSFEFVSQLRRMSVVVQSVASGEMLVYVKGAPEVMVDICNPETLPSNFQELLRFYTHNGYRVIACAGKLVKQVSVDRDDAESQLDFLGFIVFENKLKASTKGTLAELRQAQLRTVMCTGDNILTAISVGRECGLVPPDVKVFVPSWVQSENRTNLVWEDVDDADAHLDPITLTPLQPVKDYKLAVTGDVFRYILTELNEQGVSEGMLMKSNIFARMSPDEKHELVERLQKLDYTVGFCGDGANDCGALKAADVGISLSEAEASIAAPFTSRVFEISCVLDVIKEGRSALVTSFSCFQYMSLYSAIQFMTITILYMRGSNLGDFQFLYIDLFLILPIAIFMAWSKPFPRLCVKRPTANLVSPKILIPMLCNIVVILVFQISLWRYVQKQPWYIHPIPGDDDAVQSSDNTVLFDFSNYQYILVALVLTTGPPYRQPVSKNIPFILNVIVAILISTMIMLLDPESWLGQLLDLTSISHSFKLLVTVTWVGNLGVMLFCDAYLYKQLARVYKKFSAHSGSKKRFKNLRAQEVVSV
ncbi:hypothetical protein BABINDRAFT_162923 [Babjeviella inositovora NRRL Y-12698]|uniref:Cation-transporting ATPase n=1 Tax=Babjeviella inositovora NRRL Y-12698 TaxID=984486 RepID=A0A1E3QKN7_9ASCO|nr:uncharacterized protein BABINDRAFT_162923 [Babjeviella inositovora NRRL Y-12698]ODQ78269.1 hypothetical protein BABINDRAFT_162923 [Babjeviella inositovora NRRL Y-12698]